MGRVIWLDILRLMAAFAVIMLHISSHFHLSTQEPIYLAGTIWDSISRWGVPVFIMVSGSIFLNPNKYIDLKLLYRKYILRLFAVLIVWNLFYQGFTEFFIPYIKHTLYNEAFAVSIQSIFQIHFHLWFLPMMIGIYILIPLLKAIVNYKLEKYFLVLWLIFHLFETLSMIDFPFLYIIKDFFDELHLKMIVGYSGYFIAGYYISSHDIANKHFIFSACILFISIIITFWGTIYFHDDRLFNGLPINIILMSISVFFCGKYIFQNINSHKLSSILSHIVDNLFGVYLIHVFFLHLIWLIWRKLHIPTDFIHNFIFIPILTIVVFTLSLYSIIMMRKIPLFRKIC